jgi:iron complex transport system ATP-binding protein
LIHAVDRLHVEWPELTSIFVTHHLEEIPPSTTHALLLRAGAVVSGGEIHAQLTSDNLSRCFGLPVECHYDGERWFARAPSDWTRRGSAGRHLTDGSLA